MNKDIGLINIGSICYLNSLLQSLITSDTFNAAIDHNKNMFIKRTNVIGLLFYNIINKIINNIKLDTENCIIGLKLNFVGQNCSHEALTLIIDHLKFGYLFGMVYKTSIYCTTCNKITRENLDTSFMFNYFFEPVEDFVSLINGNSSINDDYRCDVCRQRSHIFYHTLTSSSSIFVILFNQYARKGIKRYKRNITLTTGRYKLFAKINHIGDSNSGHYWMVRYYGNRIIIINDMDITEVDEDEFNIYTYMLFYSRVR